MKRACSTPSNRSTRKVLALAVALSCFKFTGLHKVIGHYVEYPNER